MNNSLFANGEATSPGGRVAVVGPYGDFHSIQVVIFIVRMVIIFILATHNLWEIMPRVWEVQWHCWGV